MRWGSLLQTEMKKLFQSASGRGPLQSHLRSVHSHPHPQRFPNVCRPVGEPPTPPPSIMARSEVAVYILNIPDAGHPGNVPRTSRTDFFF